jgi:hypothetical protein
MGFFSPGSDYTDREYRGIGTSAAQMANVANQRSAADYGRYEGFIDPMQGAWASRFFDANGNFVAPGGGGGAYHAPNYDLSDYEKNKTFYGGLRDTGWGSEEDKLAAQGYGKFQAAAEGGMRGLIGADEYGRIKSGGLANFMPAFEGGAMRAGRINAGGAGRLGGNLRQMMQDQVRGNTAFMGNLASMNADAAKWGAGKGLDYANATTANRLSGAGGVTDMADKLNQYKREEAAGRNAAASRAADWERDMFNDMWKYGMSGAELTGANSQGWAGSANQSMGTRLNAVNSSLQGQTSTADKIGGMVKTGAKLAGTIGTVAALL